jgi:fructosamine-3-kinase
MDNDWINQLPLDGVRRVTRVGVGDVNQAYRIDTGKKSYFLLVQPNHPQSFYASEIAGLKAFKEAGIPAPRVIADGQINRDAYLLLSYLERGTGKQSDLGKLVAHLHRHESPNGRYGFDNPYSGSSITFTNNWTNSWTELFVNRRLEYLFRCCKRTDCGPDTKSSYTKRVMTSLSLSWHTIRVNPCCCMVIYGAATICF